MNENTNAAAHDDEVLALKLAEVLQALTIRLDGTTDDDEAEDEDEADDGPAATEVPTPGGVQ